MDKFSTFSIASSVWILLCLMLTRIFCVSLHYGFNNAVFTGLSSAGIDNRD